MARTLLTGGRGTCVPVGAAPLGEGASAVVSMARDGGPVPVLVAEVLLQRSRGKTVATVYDRLFARWPTAEGLSHARVDSIASVIRPLGLVRRAATLKSLATAIVEHGSVPGSMDELLSLPGVGRYAASATLAVAFEKYAPVVDGVTARVYRRFFGMESACLPFRTSSSGSWLRGSPPGSASGSGTGRCWIWPLRCASRKSPGARSVPCGRAAPGS